MNPDPCPAPARPFFLDTPHGKRFCLYHPPTTVSNDECKGAVLYVHPFAEEMNMSRRVASQQARAFSAMGFGVLQMDLFGCGDSEGELREASWRIWMQDLAAASNWLQTHVASKVSLWGLRLGATLAVDFAIAPDRRIDRLILWQPVISGKTHLNQYLRLRMAEDLFAAGVPKGSGLQSLREELGSGEVVEVGGYELTSALSDGIDATDLRNLSGVHIPVHWFEIVSGQEGSVPAERMRTSYRWKENKINVHLQAVSGDAFWSAKETCECPQLIFTTSRMMQEELYEL